MNDSHDGATGAGKQLALVQLPVSDGEENETEKGIESGSQERQEVSHAGDDLGEDEGDDPDADHDEDPCTPSEDGVAVSVSGLAHDVAVDEFGTDVGVDDTDDEGGDNDKGERGLSVNQRSETAKGRGSSVLAEVSESDGGWNDEEEGGDTGQDSQRLLKVLRTFHLRNEGREENLRDPEEGDVQDSVHAINPSGALGWESVSLDRTICWVVSVVAVTRSVFDTGKDKEEENGKSHTSSYTWMSIRASWSLIQMTYQRR